MGIAEQSISIGAKVLWTQENIVNKEAAKLAENAGLKVVMNRCPKKELSKSYWTTKTK
jgi:predicted CoA-binding protein